MNSLNSYIFPFSTCEKPTSGLIAQPYSTFFNVIGCMVIIYFLNKAKKNTAKILLTSILLFELSHTFSHSIHLDSNIQTVITHILACFVNLCFFTALYNYSNHFPNKMFLCSLLFLTLFDIYSFFNLPFIFYFLCQLLIFSSLFFYYYKYFSNDIKEKIPIIIFFIFILILLVLNECYNCEKLLNDYNLFPFHIFIEIIGIILLYNISSIFYRL